MPSTTLRANARTLPNDTRLRARLAAAAERIIAALDALDEPDMDREDGHDAEANADDEEPSLGFPERVKHTGVYDYTPGDDLEDDPAEAGIADDDGYREQLVGEPSLGATLDVDQTVAWGADRLAGVFDGEASGTEDDIEGPGHDGEAWTARRAARNGARTQLDALLVRRMRR